MLDIVLCDWGSCCELGSRSLGFKLGQKEVSRREPVRNSSGHEKKCEATTVMAFKARQESSQVGWPGVVTGRTRLRAPGRKELRVQGREQAGKVLDGGQSRMQ